MPAEGASDAEVKSFGSTAVAVRDGAVVVKLPSSLDNSVCHDLHEALLDATGRGRDLILEADRVDRVSTPCVQVLVAAGLVQEDSGKEKKLLNPSAAFVDAFDDLGLFSVLMKWEVLT